MTVTLRFILAAAAITLILFYALPRLTTSRTQTQPDTPQTKAPLTPSGQPPQKITLITTTQTTDSLMAEGGTTRSDIETIDNLLRIYRQAYQGNPTGENEEITAALTGKNKKAIAVIPSTHRGINKQGELIDRWNTPYFFHAISGRQMEIRSAGPDRKLYTEDDILSHE